MRLDIYLGTTLARSAIVDEDSLTGYTAMVLSLHCLQVAEKAPTVIWDPEGPGYAVVQDLGQLEGHVFQRFCGFKTLNEFEPRHLTREFGLFLLAGVTTNGNTKEDYLFDIVQFDELSFLNGCLQALQDFESDYHNFFYFYPFNRLATVLPPVDDDQDRLYYFYSLWPTDQEIPLGLHDFYYENGRLPPVLSNLISPLFQGIHRRLLVSSDYQMPANPDPTIKENEPGVYTDHNMGSRDDSVFDNPTQQEINP